jgi:polysaccharide export outer membrane protein
MKKTLYQYIFPLLIAFLALSSCVQQKQIAYFQKAINQSDTVAVAQAYTPKIQPGDILDIPIGSLNPLASSFFNPYSTMPVNQDNNGRALSSQTGGNSTNTVSPVLSQSSAPGYLVDQAGNIEMTLIGTIKIAGLTTSAARDTLKAHLKLYLKEPTVNVRFLNYRISVMGEVLRPSVYVIPNETITLPEALSLAGDMTIYGVRDDVLVIRDQDGKKVFGHVNLNTRDVYTSPFYYLHANDVVYVTPGKGKIAQSDRTYQILPIILSALSFISIILVYSKK